MSAQRFIVFQCKLVAYCIDSSLGQRGIFNVHIPKRMLLLVLAVSQFYSLIWTFGHTIHTHQIAPILCLQIQSVLCPQYPTTEEKMHFE